MTVTSATHTVRADNMAIAHVRGVQPMPVSLTGGPPRTARPSSRPSTRRCAWWSRWLWTA
ncbi:hypothetical protein [Geodermatophilus arenarius]|uniref:hypothetical protein n=1 Tax=Geodermatophilus arenarius TaxID=1137990 RepID=UPI0036DB4B8A